MKYMKGILSLLIVILTLGISMTAFGFLGIGGDSWKEEVLLHDGGKLIVERSVERGGRHEIGQEGPYTQQSLTFTMPDSKQQVTWEDTFSEELGMANFLPMLLDIRNNSAYLVVSPMGCLSYNKWGRPNPPYVVFKLEGNAWRRIPLEELPAEITKPNLIFSAPDRAVKKAETRFMSAEMIRKIISGYRQPEYQAILRELIPAGGHGRCPKTDYYGKAGWLGIDWFTDQPTYEACIKFCELKRILPQDCPCETLFKGKK
jgi:hypothetical protein